MRNLINKILRTGPDADFNRLLIEAGKFPRYTHHTFQFRGLTLTVTDFISVAWQLKEIFIDNDLEFSSNKKSPLIIDCGSNVGVSLIYFRKLFPDARIIAFEPDPEIYKCLLENLVKNKIGNIECFQKAVWIDNNGVSFGSDGADGGSIYSEKNIKTLPSARLKEILSKESEIDLLKIDIEGPEVKVIDDCKDELTKVKNIFVEYHSWKNKPQELDKLLSILSLKGFRYYIRSLGNSIVNPFMKNESSNPMDVQLNIHAIHK